MNLNLLHKTEITSTTEVTWYKEEIPISIIEVLKQGGIEHPRNHLIKTGEILETKEREDI